ncbi:hypothetical protein C7E17_27145, partial [Stenotrophomonas maltophilia]
PGRYLTWHQSVIDPPNAFIRQQGEAVADAKTGDSSSVQQHAGALPDLAPVGDRSSERLHPPAG